MTPRDDARVRDDMDSSSDTFDFHAGDHVTLVDDDWSLVGHDIVLVDAEPVPGSTQCIVRADDGETRVVSRFTLRPASAT